MLDIQHIGAKVGILDSNYFTRCFKKQFNVSSTEYRRLRLPNISEESTQNVENKLAEVTCMH
ncbi:AraC family transcriptional regulator [Ruthenibacterium lactatiformans]|jgi:AraC-like DNA-binding protein|uniref:AraC family transcriptional regulator n=1 Tax=Ruthenibacterium lactatiformans TaxID=1550024 RepID=UPI00196732E7|nr:AraC family transcriptional regulator [Ruthenibacterium lactatiformans]MBN3010348.1 AraC family transcriptional regulator [Ruthenibacterium lactatiformans]